MTTESSWVVYGLRLRDESEYRYVGYTTIGAERRLAKHKQSMKYRKYYVYSWMTSNGADNIVVDVLEECPPGDMIALAEAEKKWIAELKARGNRLTNLNDGGMGGSAGRVLSAETRAKISAGQLGDLHPNYGKTLPDATKLKMSAAKSGQNNPRYGVEVSAGTRSKLSKALIGNNRNARGLHNRWHKGRGIVNPDCALCQS